jgi:muconolactone delta-isomerase
MMFLVEMDHARPAVPATPEAGRMFIEQVILPTLARGEQLIEEKKILAGGAATGRIALRFIAQVDSLPELDRMLTSVPLWRQAETRVTPLIEFNDRREGVGQVMRDLGSLVG